MMKKIEAGDEVWFLDCLFGVVGGTIMEHLEDESKVLVKATMWDEEKERWEEIEFLVSLKDLYDSEESLLLNML